MKNMILVLTIITALIGLFFLGKGLTGFVVSESCCFGEHCQEENLCDKPRLESPKATSNLETGIVLLFISVAIYVIRRRMP